MAEKRQMISDKERQKDERNLDERERAAKEKENESESRFVFSAFFLLVCSNSYFSSFLS